MAAAADAPEVVGILPNLDDSAEEPEANLIAPEGLRFTLDQVVNEESGVTLAMVMDDQVLAIYCLWCAGCTISFVAHS